MTAQDHTPATGRGLAGGLLPARLKRMSPLIPAVVRALVAGRPAA